jgi:hypothetical protein
MLLHFEESMKRVFTLRGFGASVQQNDDAFRRRRGKSLNGTVSGSSARSDQSVGCHGESVPARLVPANADLPNHRRRVAQGLIVPRRLTVDSQGLAGMLIGVLAIVGGLVLS